MAVTTQPIESTKQRSRTWQTLRASTWLEWQTRGNWTNPWLFGIFLFGRPISAALVLVFMYKVVGASSANSPYLLGYLIIGSASWAFVEQILAGLPQAVLADREEYAMLKYVYIAPQQFVIFLLGRSIPRMLFAALSFVVTLGFGIVFLNVPVNVQLINYGLLAVALLFGFAAIAALSVAFAGLALMLKRGAYQMPQAVTGSLYLITGAIFPVVVLPLWLRDISLAVPLTYWLELMRRALMGDTVDTRFNFPVENTWGVLALLVLTTIIYVFLALVAFRFCDNIARERGQIDRTTGN